MVMTKAMVAAAMMEVGLALLSLERGRLKGEREGDGRWTQGLRESWNVGNGLGGRDKSRKG